jgi:hypothetical protein
LVLVVIAIIGFPWFFRDLLGELLLEGGVLPDDFLLFLCLGFAHSKFQTM